MAATPADSPQVSGCPVRGLGATYTPFEGPQLQSPLQVWEESRRDEPVFFSEVLGAWIISRYEDVDFVYRNPAIFSSELDNRLTPYPPEAQAILHGIPDYEDTKAPRNDPPYHGRLRRYMQKSFLPKKLAAREHEIETLAHRLVDHMGEEGGEFYTGFGSPFALAVMGLILRLPTETLQQIQAWTEADMIFRHGHPTAEQAIEGAHAVRSFWNLAVELLEERRRNPQDDFVSDAVAMNDASDDPLTEREMVGQVVQVFLGGFETSASWLTMAVGLLLEGDRQRWLDLRERPDDINLVVEETLRLRASAQTNWRTPVHDVEIAGVTIPAGSRVGILPLSANRDSAVFERADEYDPHRPDLKKHIAFGRGIHVCVGAGVTRQEGRIGLRVLSERLPDLRRDPDYDDIHYLPNAMLIMPRGLHLRWDSAPAT